MEHFCLGRRRLHLFGNDSTIRPGVCGVCVGCGVCLVVECEGDNCGHLMFAK